MFISSTNLVSIYLATDSTICSAVCFEEHEPVDVEPIPQVRISESLRCLNPSGHGLF